MVGLERSVTWHVDIIGLVLGQYGEFGAELFKVQGRDFFIEMLWQDVDFVFVVVALCPKFDLGQRLIGEAG